MATFSGSFISNTYQRVLQIDGTLQDGTGSLITSLPVTASDATTSSFAHSATSASYAVSASYAISASFEITKEVSSSYADTASFVEYTGIANKPTLISGSAQIADDISGSFTSTSASLASDISSNNSEITSLTLSTGSYATTGSNIFSGSLTVSSSQVLTLEPSPTLPTGQSTGSLVVSGSGADLSLYIFAGTGSFGDGYLKITGNLS